MQRLVRKQFFGAENFTIPPGITKILINPHPVAFSLSASKVISTAHEVYAWGAGTAGQLGNNAIIDSSSPVLVAGGKRFIRMSQGRFGTLAIEKDTYDMYGWGLNSNGGLGNNTASTQSSPVLVAGGRKFISVDTPGGIIGGGTGFGRHTVAIEKDTYLAYAWGKGDGGQLGDNTIISKSSPVAVAGGRKFVKVAAGIHSLAIEKDTHDAYTWGGNALGELGNNTTTATSSPVAVAGGKKFIAISANAFFSVAIEKDTYLAYTWGDGSVGALGNNTLDNVSSPVVVAGGKKFFTISASAYGVLALEKDTYLAYTWGDNTLGQLGDNTIISKSSPVAVAGGRKFIAIGADDQSHFAIEKDTYDIYAWGANANGNLGNNSLTSTSSPVLVAGSINGRQGTPQSLISLDVVPNQIYAVDPSIGKFGSLSMPIAGGSIVNFIEIYWFE